MDYASTKKCKMPKQKTVSQTYVQLTVSDFAEPEGMG